MTTTLLSLIANLLLATGTACSSPGTAVEEPTPKPAEPTEPVTGNTATVYTTTANGAKLQQSALAVSNGVGMEPRTLELNAARSFQSMDGFGFAITYSSCYNLLKMKAADRAAFIKQTYSPTEGYGVSYARISIGCNDFSSTEYTLCDKLGLENFALQSDELNYVIPVLKEILAVNPNLKIIAAPWTCPKWMKVSDINTKQPHNAWTDGHVNPDLYATYADYFVRFIRAMKAQGINIYAVSPQNEPLNPANCASTVMTWQEQAQFVKFMAKAFKNNKLTTKIYLFDHNYNYDNKADQVDYPVKIYNAIGNTYEGSELVVGAAYHDYGGSNVELSDIYNQAPDKELIFSETSIGEWNDGRNLSKRLLADMENVALGTVNRQCKAVLVWNLMLDVNKGPNLDGGCQTCYGAVDIALDYTTLTRNSHYYIITHLSAVVQPGAVRIDASPSFDTKGLVFSAFKNPDGTFALVALNKNSTPQSFVVTNGTNRFSLTVPAQGVVSCKWK